MGDRTGIAWTHRTWNPWMGCERVSPGCDNCYMFRDMKHYGRNPDVVQRTSDATFNRPLTWEREQVRMLVANGDLGRSPKHVLDFGPRIPGRPEPGSLVFLASWSDFFHDDADEWRPAAWEIIKRCPHLTFQILTKRHGRIAKSLPPDWGPKGYPNVWLGVSGEDRDWWHRRAMALVQIPAAVRFISYEPAVGPVSGLAADGIDWIIVGGESAPGRSFHIEWAHQAIAIARQAGASVFVKQLGCAPHVMEREAPVRIRLKDGRAGADPLEWPAELQVQEFPTPRAA